MEMELNAATMKALAKEIARAQLTAADDLIEEEMAQWSDSVKAQHHVPAASQASQAARWEAFRTHRASAANMMESEARDIAERQARGAAALEEFTRNRERQLEQNLADYEVALAQWEADKVAARNNGTPEPARPAAPPLTSEELATAESKARFNEIF